MCAVDCIPEMKQKKTNKRERERDRDRDGKMVHLWVGFALLHYYTFHTFRKLLMYILPSKWLKLYWKINNQKKKNICRKFITLNVKWMKLHLYTWWWCGCCIWTQITTTKTNSSKIKVGRTFSTFIFKIQFCTVPLTEWWRKWFSWYGKSVHECNSIRNILSNMQWKQHQKQFK